jgi:hypothetical protein
VPRGSSERIRVELATPPDLGIDVSSSDAGPGKRKQSMAGTALVAARTARRSLWDEAIGVLTPPRIKPPLGRRTRPGARPAQRTHMPRSVRVSRGLCRR